MKSEQAEKFLYDHECGYPYSGYVTMQDAERAAELAEQEAEERGRDKAIEAFCKDCPIYSIQTSNGGNCPDCSALNAFKQKLNEG